MCAPVISHGRPHGEDERTLAFVNSPWNQSRQYKMGMYVPCHQCTRGRTSYTLPVMKLPVSRQATQWQAVACAKLAAVPNFDSIKTSLPDASARRCYLAVHDAVAQLGRATQLGQHRLLIEHLDGLLTSDTLEAIALASEMDSEICAAFSVYLTTLEQAYHWPRTAPTSTPASLHDHKLVIQVLYHAELRSILNQASERTASFPMSTARAALELARTILQTAQDARNQGAPLSDKMQVRVNLLYRTCSQDWFVQGDYNDHDSHREFGRLHDYVRTHGTQRSVQQIFETTAMHSLRQMPYLLSNLPSTADATIASLGHLQLAVTLAREELFNMVVDEVVWGQTFAKHSKPVGFSSLGSGGADCPMFRMLDALCGRADDSSQDVLLSELDMRTRHFPPNMRRLISALAAAPSLRARVSSREAGHDLTHRFKAFQQSMWDLYEMHRKKAMRIVLALRAGQLFTSSGTQNAASPEWHISNSLRSAMKIRFGTDSQSRLIAGYALSAPLIKGPDGTTEAACIRLVFKSPLVVGAGDAMSITVQVEPGMPQTRTYSITRILAQTPSVDSQDFQTTTSVEVCCRRAGQVSSYLCSQRGQFPVQVALQPMPHFRLTGNSSPKHHTVLIAQGGAVGLFLFWLARQTRLVGSYLLAIGVRSLDLLAYADQLYELVDASKGSLRVVVAASQARPCDFMTAGMRNIELYSGRVTSYLESRQVPHTRATYVCGSARFGLDVAGCLKGHRQANSSTFGPRLSSITTSSLPDLRLHVASAARRSSDESPELPSISRAQLAMHNSPGDAWISIGHTVYDISILSSFHPGGEKTLICRAGLDADDMFNSVHEGSHEVLSLLEQMAIGKLATTPEEYQQWDDYLEKIVQIQNDMTNTSRFEQRPTGSPEQLSQAPPVELVRNSLSQFVTAWTGLEPSGTPAGGIVGLQSMLDRVLRMWDRKQSLLYKEHFNNSEHCALGLRDIFNHHQTIVENIHITLDWLKREVLASINNIQLEKATLFALASHKFCQAFDISHKDVSLS